MSGDTAAYVSTLNERSFSPEQETSSDTWYRYNVFFAVLMVVLILILIVGAVALSSAKTYDATYFRDTINNSAELPLLRPIVVSIFERAVRQGDDDDDEDVDGTATVRNLSDDDLYNERLVVVRPNNWLIYTNNGLTFHYVTSNVSGSRVNCSTSGSLTAVEYRLKKLDELTTSANVDDNDDYDSTTDDGPSRSLRFSCINYTFDQLTRVFTQSSNRTDIDMTDYFDKKNRPKVPDFTVANVLQFLVTNDYL